jgi:hypothetical protein
VYGLKKRELYNYTVDLCNRFQTEDGMPESFRLKKLERE